MTWTDEAETLLREISPEDFGGGCYVVDGATLPKVEGIGGFTSGLLDVALSPWLQEHGRWQGRGFACVCYPEHFPTQSQLIGVVIHEAAHHIEHKAVSRFLVLN